MARLFKVLIVVTSRRVLPRIARSTLHPVNLARGSLRALFCLALFLGAGPVPTWADEARGPAPREDRKAEEPKKAETPAKPAVAGPKKRLAVVDLEERFERKTYLTPTTRGGFTRTTTVYYPPPDNFGRGMTEMLTTALLETERFIVLERKYLEDILKELGLGEADLLDPEKRPQMGKLLGAQWLIRGAITEYSCSSSSKGVSVGGVKVGKTTLEAKVAVDLRIYDAETGEVVASQRGEGQAKSETKGLAGDFRGFQFDTTEFKGSPLDKAVRDALTSGVQFIVGKLETLPCPPWRSRISNVVGDQIYITGGKNAGVRVGDRFEVSHPGEPIVDPETGEVLGYTETKVGVIQVQTVQEKFSIAMVVEGQGFAKGDFVVYLPSRARPGKTESPAPAAEPPASEDAESPGKSPQSEEPTDESGDEAPSKDSQSPE